MRERPILFSAPMVRALLGGRKTQTRRVSGLEVINAEPDRYEFLGITSGPGVPHFAFHDRQSGAQVLVRCKHGEPGDQLWVRETHAPQADCWGSWERWLRGAGGPAPIIHYAADFEPFQDGQGLTVRKPFIEKWRPSIHMPRWASRIDLGVTAVRIERLQDISEQDAMDEGFYQAVHESPTGIGQDVVGWYRGLWEELNGAGSWEANPWVWVLGFGRAKQ